MTRRSTQVVLLVLAATAAYGGLSALFAPCSCHTGPAGRHRSITTDGGAR